MTDSSDPKQGTEDYFRGLGFDEAEAENLASHWNQGEESAARHFPPSANKER